MAQLIELNGVQKFEPRGDRQGPEVQDIFYTLPDREPAGEEVSAYRAAVAALNKYFKGKVNVPYERYVFRNLVQGTDSIDHFITKLKQQAKFCNFGNEDEQIPDQIIEKCASQKLRIRLLEKGQDLTLDQLRAIAQSLETSQSHAVQMEKNSICGNSSRTGEIHKISPKSKGRRQPKTCFNCGREGHFGRDSECPARGQKCKSCGKVGHFAARCRSRNGQHAGRSKGHNSSANDRH
ncbi:uncharacterized protein LOC132547380 [Ylistrum balloti]|uniref:uncharacterized protein LOC132547380 n=1 Tax=Ylistrum balloti TaxID=509963 RepID=UPI002905AB56|nr:uncharacterized protein LOC132547380 [Ylistrum balloti]